MATIETRIMALEQHSQINESRLLPLVVPDDCTDEAMEKIRRTGRKVFRFSDHALFDAFI